MTVHVEDENTPLIPVFNSDVGRMSKLQFRVILGCLYANVFLASVDSTMVATLLGKIASDLDAQENISWVATSYLLSCAACQPLFGKISDVFGRKPIILFSTVCFFVGCFICGVGNNVITLVIGRLITGIGGGGFFTLASITCSDIVLLKERGLYQGYINIFFHLGAVSGGVLSGIIDSYLGWKWAFLLQVPVCFVTGTAVYWYLDLPPRPEDLDNDRKTHWQKFISLDWTGAFILVSSLLALMVVSGFNPSDSHLVTSFYYISVLLGFTAFYFWELNVDQPVIPVKMLHNQTVLASSLNCFFTSINMFSSLFYLPFYWSSVKNVSPLDCGYRSISGSVVASFTSIFAGWLIKKTAKYKTLHYISAITIVLGSFLLYSSTRYDGAIKDSLISLPLRYGASADITTIIVAMISSVPQSQQSLVTSISYGFRSTGSTIGVSLSSAILQSTLRKSLTGNFRNLENTLLPPGWSLEMLSKAKQVALENPSYAFTEGLPETVKDAIVSSYDSAGHSIFLFLIATAICSAVCIHYTEENELEEKT